MKQQAKAYPETEFEYWDIKASLKHNTIVEHQMIPF